MTMTNITTSFTISRPDFAAIATLVKSGAKVLDLGIVRHVASGRLFAHITQKIPITGTSVLNNNIIHISSHQLMIIAVVH